MTPRSHEAGTNMLPLPPKQQLLPENKMRFNVQPSIVALALSLAPLQAAEASRPGDPADDLPPHITRISGFGERADWSHDGKKILFLSKTFGDALEIDLSTRLVRNITAHYPHHGYTRALYL